MDHFSDLASFYTAWYDSRLQLSSVNHRIQSEDASLSKEETKVLALYDLLDDLLHCLDDHVRMGLSSLLPHGHLLEDMASRLMNVGHVTLLAQKVQSLASWLQETHKKSSHRVGIDLPIATIFKYKTLKSFSFLLNVWHR